MKIKQIAIFSTVAIFLLFITGKCLFLYIQLQKENKRHVNNEQTLTAKIKYYEDQKGRETARTGTLELTVSELSKILPEIRQELKDLKIKSGRVESFSETHIIQNKDIKQVLRDSIIYNHIPVKTFGYTDPWYSIKAIIQNDSVDLNISSYDTIIQVVSRGDRIKPWLWIFSPRQLVQTIQSRNPSNHINYSMYIKIKK